MKHDQGYSPPIETSFATWRRKCGLSQRQAAALLGKTIGMISFYDKGWGPRGRAIPPDDCLKLMKAIADGFTAEPWPLTNDEKAARDAGPSKRAKVA